MEIKWGEREVENNKDKILKMKNIKCRRLRWKNQKIWKVIEKEHLK